MKNFYQISLSAVLALGWCSEIRGQDAAAAPAGDKVPKVARRGVDHVGVLVEWIEVDARTANKLIRKHLSQAGPAAIPNVLRNEVEKLIDAGEATLMDTNYIMVKPGMRAKVESIDEVIYPTEYEPSQIPQTLGLLAAKMEPTAATPSGFDVRNAGPTVEVEPNIDASGTVIDMNMAPEWVTYEGRQPVSREDTPNAEVGDVWQPDFNMMKFATAFQVRDGESKLVTVARPKAQGKRILVFVQAKVLR